MADSTSALTPVFSYLGWAFLPGYATSFIQSMYYRLTLRAGTQPPQPGTPRFARDHRRIRVLVLSLYLVYTLLQSLYDIKLKGDFYTVLGVSPYNFSEREVRSKFRRLAARYHPDKLNAQGQAQAQSAAADPASGAGTTTAAESHFLLLKLAQDTLLSPSLRYAYTHFGPGITTIHLPNPHSTPISSYVYAGLQQSVPSYAVNLLSLVVLNYFVLPKSGQFWRYLIVGVSALLELYLLTHDVEGFLPSSRSSSHVLDVLRRLTPHQLLDILPTHLLPYQLLLVSRTLGISLNIFISQVASLSSPRGASSGGSTVTSLRAQQAQFLASLNAALTNLQTLASRTDKESTDVLRLQLTPFKGDPERVSDLRDGMREGMVMGVARASPEVQEAMQRALDRRKRAQGHMDGKGGGAMSEDGSADMDGSDVVDILNSDAQL